MTSTPGVLVRKLTQSPMSDFLRLQAYQSQAECESNNRDAMESFVRTGFYPAMMGSIYRWDLSRKHDVTEW